MVFIFVQYKFSASLLVPCTDAYERQKNTEQNTFTDGKMGAQPTLSWQPHNYSKQ